MLSSDERKGARFFSALVVKKKVKSSTSTFFFTASGEKKSVQASGTTFFFTNQW